MTTQPQNIDNPLLWLQNASKCAQRELKRQQDGLATAHLLAKCIDRIITHLWQPQTTANPDQLPAVLAIGGYGRSVRAPHSDIDLTFIQDKSANPNDSSIQNLVCQLWNLKLTVNHTVRTIAQSLTLAKKDHTVATALLDRRFVAGNASLAHNFDQALNRLAKHETSSFISAKLNERDARHRRHGDSRYLVEPDVKNGKGGLRDLQTLYWIAKHAKGGNNLDQVLNNGVFSDQEARSFRAHARFLWAVRHHMHLITGRATEKLTFDLQPELAQRMGYRATKHLSAVERFMKRYFLAARDAGALTRILCSQLEQQERNRSKPTRPRPGPTNSTGSFHIQNGRLNTGTNTSDTDNAFNLVRLFALAGQRGLDVHPDAMSQARRRARSVTSLRNDPHTSECFMSILTDTQHPGPPLRLMHESGVLGALIPEFGRIVGQTQFNMYHHYTVDEHTLIAIETLADMDNGILASDLPHQSRIISQIKNKRALYLATLLHDIGKGRGDQQIQGARLGKIAASRLGLAPDEADLVAWLIGNHLEMSDVAQRRDICDPEIILQFTERVKTIERLNLLYLLTSADIRAVGPGIWNAWKARLLKDLHLACSAQLTSHNLTGTIPNQTSRPDPDIQTTLLAGINASYFRRHHKSEREKHKNVIQTAADGHAVGGYAHPDRGGTRLVVSAADRLGLFADLAAFIIQSGNKLVATRLYDLANNRVLDLIDIQTRSGTALLDSDTARLVFDINNGLNLPVAPPANASPSRRRDAFIVKPDITLTQNNNHTMTVTVSARNLPNVIYDLARILADFHLSIRSAYIDRHGARVHSVFDVKNHTGNSDHFSQQTKLVNALRQAASRNETTPWGLRRAPASADR